MSLYVPGSTLHYSYAACRSADLFTEDFLDDKPLSVALDAVGQSFWFSFMARDFEGLRLDHDVVGWGLTVARNGQVLPTGSRGSPQIEYRNDGLYNVTILPDRRGDYTLTVSHDGASFVGKSVVALRVSCTVGMAPLPTPPHDDGLCGCAAGSQPDLVRPPCKPCDKNTYKDAATAAMLPDAVCTPCFEYASSAEGQMSIEACQCKREYFRVHNTSLDPTNQSSSYTCQPCPEGANCSVAGITLETLPLLPGYWRVSSWSLNVATCPGDQACLGGAALSARCACTGGGYPCPRPEENAVCARELDVCGYGYVGPLCSVCDNGFYRQSKGVCAACEQENYLAGTLLQLIAVVLAVLLIGVLFWRLARYKKSADVLKAKTHAVSANAR